MKTSFTSRTVTLFSFLALACLPGCTNFFAFSDSAAMRVEVEVYKGPLSLEPEIQLNELYGYLIEAQRGMMGVWDLASSIDLDSIFRTKFSKSLINKVQEDSLNLNGQLHRAICSLGPESADCTTPILNKTAIDKFQREATSPLEVNSYTAERANKIAKEILMEINTQYKMANKNKATTSLTDVFAKNKSAVVLAEISRTAAAMQAAAFSYSTMSAIGTPWDTKARIAATLFSVAASEYGNQIEARADALIKQLSPGGRDRRELPLSTHLRETEPTDFVHLFDWVDGHTPRPLDYLTFNISPNMDERIKIIERLYADHFWSKINTVYASGRGKTQMAFIKDETGNWNLKSFDNDPTELLDAYTKAAKAALDGVVKVTESLASGGTSLAGKELANQLLAIADQTAPDKPQPVAAPAGTLSLTHLQNRLLTQLDPVALKKDLDDDAANVKAVNDETDLSKKPDKQKALKEHRESVIKKWTDQINDHSNLVDILSTTVKKK